jgi:hypothetical protein
MIQVPSFDLFGRVGRETVVSPLPVRRKRLLGCFWVGFSVLFVVWGLFELSLVLFSCVLTWLFVGLYGVLCIFNMGLGSGKFGV